MKSNRKTKRLTRQQRLELAQRHFEGAKNTSLQKRFCVSETDVNRVIKQFQSGRIFSKSKAAKWQPHFDRPEVVHHPIGKNAYRALSTGNGDDPFLSPLDPDLDVANGLLHLRWSKDDINDLLFGMVKRCFAILKEGKSSSAEYQEEIEFLESPLFDEICRSLGLDPDELKSTFEYKSQRRQKAITMNARLSAAIGDLLN